MFDDRCPRCAANEDISGCTTGEGIELTCDSCGHGWLRGLLRCRGCGGTASISRPQQLVVNPRGNQYATVGLVETRLCPDCDAEVLASTHAGQWLPDGYPSRFVNGRREPANPSSSPASVRPPATPPSPAAPPQRPGPSTRSKAESTLSSQAGDRVHAKIPLTDPTVRQAIASSLSDHPGLDASLVTLLAMHLGPSTRLAALGHAIEPVALEQWLAARRLPRSARDVVETLRSDWVSKGWLK